MQPGNLLSLQKEYKALSHKNVIYNKTVKRKEVRMYRQTLHTKRKKHFANPDVHYFVD